MKEDDNFLEKILPQDEISSKKVDQVLRESGLGAQGKKPANPQNYAL